MIESKKYNKVVIVEDNTITVLKESFKHSDDFKGLIGINFEIISKDEYDEIIEPYLNDKIELIKYYADAGCDITSDFIDGIEADEESIKNLMFDTSYSNLWEYLREKLNLSEDEAYIFNCVGGGRCFKKGDVFTHNKKLQYLIDEFE